MRHARTVQVTRHGVDEFDGHTLGNISPSAELRALLNIIRILVRTDRESSSRARFIEVLDVHNERLHLLTHVINRNLRNVRFTGKRLVAWHVALREQVYAWEAIIIDYCPTTPVIRPPALRLC